MPDWHHDKFSAAEQDGEGFGFGGASVGQAAAGHSSGGGGGGGSGSGPGGLRGGGGQGGPGGHSEELWRSRAGGVYIPNAGAIAAQDALGRERYWGTASKHLDTADLAGLRVRIKR
jgi:hypothetical protein